MYEYEYGFYYPYPARYLGTILVLVIGIPVSSGSILVGCLIPLALILVWSRGGTEINFEKGEYRDYQNFFLFRTGKWLTIKPSYLSVFKAKMVKTVGSIMANSTYEFGEFHVNLITSEKKRINLFETEIRKKAFEFASDMAIKYKLKILDATSANQKWLN